MRGFWHRLAWGVMRRPVRIILVVVVVVLVIGIPAWHLRVGVPGPEILPTSVESRAGNDILNQHLGLANGEPVLVTVVRKPGTPASTSQATSFTVLDRICSSPVVAGISSVPVPRSPSQIRSCSATLNALQNATPAQVQQARGVAARHRVGLISVFLRVNASSHAAERYVSTMRSQPPIPGYRVLVGGQTAGQMDFDNYLYSRFPLIALAVIVTIFFVLLIAFRSLLLPLKAILMNVFSVLAAYGAVVWAFQDGHLSGVLNFTSIGNIDSIVPVFLFNVLFGVSTDYEVFLLTRVQEEYRRTGDNDASVATGLEVTGRIITSAAAVMIVVFAAFSFARLVVIQEVGFGLAVAVLLDATLIRALLVPATMRLLGRWNWWLPVRGFAAPTPAPSGHSTAAQ
jgi:RND superfamily putative drug exporter